MSGQTLPNLKERRERVGSLSGAAGRAPPDPNAEESKLHVSEAQLQTWRQENAAGMRAKARNEASCWTRCCAWLCGGDTIVDTDTAEEPVVVVTRDNPAHAQPGAGAGAGPAPGTGAAAGV